MNRRKFLVVLGAAPIALVAAKFLPAAPPVGGYISNEPLVLGDLHTVHPALAARQFGRGTTIHDWQPNTAYKIGDRVRFSTGQTVELQMSGTSASVESINGTILPLKGDW